MYHSDSVSAMGIHKGSYRNKHSAFSSEFPIYLFTQRDEIVPDEDEASSPEIDTEESPATTPEPEDDEEAIVEDVSDDEEEKSDKPKKTKTVTVDEWIQMNPQPPIWMRFVTLAYGSLPSSPLCYVIQGP